MSSPEIHPSGSDEDGGRNRFQIYFEHSTDAVLVARLHPDGRFTYESVNIAAQKLFGLAADQVLGRTPHDAFVAETAYAHEKSYRVAVAHGGEPVTLQHKLVYPAGSLHTETILTAVRDQWDGSTRIISGSRDLAAREQMQARMQQSECLEVIAQLTGGVAHDVNNLLTVVIGNLALLRRRIDPADGKARRYLDSIEAVSARGTKLTASLLAFSRRQTLKLERLDLARHVMLNEPSLRQVAGRDIALTVAVGADLVPARVDEAHFDIAMLNLLSNARDAVAESTAQGAAEIAISVRRANLGETELLGNDDAFPGEFIAVQVRDNGVGMTEAVRARAFEPFFTTKDVGRGTGLGLSHVFGFVRQLGGHVTLEAARGGGTAVTMFLPVATTSTEALEPTASTAASGANRAVVLFVEDDRSILNVTSELLRDAGLHVLTAGSAHEALAVLRGTQPIDLLFTDVVMPGGATGLDLALAAAELRPGLPILLTSGYPGPSLNRFGPITDFPILPKPFTRDALLDRIESLVAPSR